MNILYQANQIINCRSEEKDRMYGPMGEGMEIAAQIFNLITPEGQSITPEGMYWALVALKLSRQHYNHKTDNLLDAVAYIGALNNYIDSKEKQTSNESPELSESSNQSYDDIVEKTIDELTDNFKVK